MIVLNSGIVLNYNEKLIVEIEADLYRRESGFFDRANAKRRRIIDMVKGKTKRGYIVLTNKHIIEVYQSNTCCCCRDQQQIDYYPLSDIKDFGYCIDRESCCGKACYIYYETSNHIGGIDLYDSSYQEVLDLVKKFREVL